MWQSILVLFYNVCYDLSKTCIWNRAFGARAPGIPSWWLWKCGAALHAAMAAGWYQHWRAAAVVVHPLPVPATGQVCALLHPGYQTEPPACWGLQVKKTLKISPDYHVTHTLLLGILSLHNILTKFNRNKIAKTWILTQTKCSKSDIEFFFVYCCIWDLPLIKLNRLLHDTICFNITDIFLLFWS